MEVIYWRVRIRDIGYIAVIRKYKERVKALYILLPMEAGFFNKCVV